MAAYKRGVAEADAPDLGLLQGRTDALLSDARPQEAVELLTTQQRAVKPEQEGGIDPVDLQLLIGKVMHTPGLVLQPHAGLFYRRMRSTVVLIRGTGANTGVCAVAPA